MTSKIKYLSFLDAYCDEKNEQLWVSNLVFNGLFRISLNTYEVSYVGDFKGEEVWQDNLHRRIIQYMNRLFFIPFNGRGISIYSLRDGSTSYYPVSLSEERIKVADVIQKENIIWMFPGIKDQPLYLFNMDTCEITERYDWNQKARGCIEDNYDIIFDIGGVCQARDKIYLAPFSINYILEFDMDTFEFITYSIHSKYHIRNISYDGQSFWITLIDGIEVLQWDPDVNNISIYKDKDENENIIYPYTTTFSYKNDVFVLPSNASYIMKVDKVNKILISLKGYPKNFKRIRNYLLLYGFVIRNDKAILYQRSGNQLLVLDLYTYEMTGHELTIPDICLDNLTIDIVKDDNGVVWENKDDMHSLDFFLDTVSSSQDNSMNIHEANSGKRIMELIMNNDSYGVE